MEKIQNWLCNLYARTFTFGDFLTIIGMLVSIAGAIFSFLKSQDSKKSQVQAEKHAQEAGQYFRSAKEYYDELLPQLRKQNEKDERTDQKQQIFKYVKRHSDCMTSGIIAEVNLPEELVVQILDEMLHIDETLLKSGDRENLLNGRWHL